MPIIIDSDIKHIIQQKFSNLLDDEGGKYYIDVVRNYNSKMISIIYYTKKDRTIRHRDNKPGGIVLEANNYFSARNIYIKKEFYYSNNLLHRENKPSVVVYDQQGKIYSLSYHKFGKLNRFDGPAILYERMIYPVDFIKDFYNNNYRDKYYVDGKPFQSWVPCTYKNKLLDKIDKYVVLRTMLEFDREYGEYLTKFL